MWIFKKEFEDINNSNKDNNNNNSNQEDIHWCHSFHKILNLNCFLRKIKNN
jgi:hypothetical protein